MTVACCVVVIMTTSHVSPFRTPPIEFDDDPSSSFASYCDDEEYDVDENSHVEHNVLYRSADPTLFICDRHHQHTPPSTWRFPQSKTLQDASAESELSIVRRQLALVRDQNGALRQRNAALRRRCRILAAVTASSDAALLDTPRASMSPPPLPMPQPLPMPPVPTAILMSTPLPMRRPATSTDTRQMQTPLKTAAPVDDLLKRASALLTAARRPLALADDHRHAAEIQRECDDVTIHSRLSQTLSV